MPKKKIRQSNERVLKKQLKSIKHQLLYLSNDIRYLINLILQERTQEGEADGEIPAILKKRLEKKEKIIPHYFG